jgi:hypothetical protein
MEIVHADSVRTDDDPLPHRHGGIAITYLFTGDENTPDNFSWSVGHETSEYYSPRHRHNFDQIRYCISGSIPIGPHLTVDEGEVGYFPEGVHYGPQEGGPNRETLVLQFGGASGQGYLSARQLKAGHTALLAEGRFEMGVFRRTSGEGKKNQDSYDAIWQKVSGRPLEYPKARYKAPIVMKPENFDWAPVPDSPGVCRRVLGRFGERGVGIEFLAIPPGEGHDMGHSEARRLIFVCRGMGKVGGDSYSRHSAIRLEPGESVRFEAGDDTELFVITLPMIGESSAQTASAAAE